MPKGKGNIQPASEGKVINFDHLIFWVGNAKTAASYFVTRFGFENLAIKEASNDREIISHAVRLNKIKIVFQSPTTQNSELSHDISIHGDYVKDVAFEVENLEELVQQAKLAGAEIVKDIAIDSDEFGAVKYAVLRTFMNLPGVGLLLSILGIPEKKPKILRSSSRDPGDQVTICYGDNTHTLIDRSNYNGIFLPGYVSVEEDALNKLLPNTNLLYIDHVEGNMADGTLEDSVAWYERTLNMNRFWCVDYKHDLVPYSCINSASVINKEETVLLSMNEAAKGLRPSNKASDFVKALGTAGVEHVALYSDDIVETMRNLKARGAEILTWPSTYYELIRSKLESSPVIVKESIDALQENNILIDFDERGYMLQAFTKHVQPRPTLFMEVVQRMNHKGFGAMNYKWVFEAIQLLEEKKEKTEDTEKN